jgi:hypothetical protein
MTLLITVSSLQAWRAFYASKRQPEAVPSVVVDWIKMKTLEASLMFECTQGSAVSCESARRRLNAHQDTMRAFKTPAVVAELDAFKATIVPRPEAPTFMQDDQRVRLAFESGDACVCDGCPGTLAARRRAQPTGRVSEDGHRIMEYEFYLLCRFCRHELLR